MVVSPVCYDVASVSGTFFPSSASQTHSCLPAQTREPQGCRERLAALAVSGRVTDGVAEQPHCCCGAVTPAGWTRYRKSISRTCNSESVLLRLSCVDNGPIRDLRMEDAKKNGTQTQRGTDSNHDASRQELLLISLMRFKSLPPVHTLSTYMWGGFHI